MVGKVFETRFTKELGIDHPIMIGGMHHVSYGELTAAFANAGVASFITAITQPSPDALRAEIRKTKALTSKPFGVNISFLPAATPPPYEDYIKVIIDEKIPWVETAGNNPGKYIKMFKDGGCLVIHKCTSVKHALTAARSGADWISIDGYECAGHPGQNDIGGLVLLAIAQRAKELKIPFIASGGIGTGIQLAACLALGAEGINMGTRAMATKECSIHDNIKKALVDSNETNTTTILRSLKNTERVFLNEYALKAQAAEKARPGDFQVVREFISGSKYRISFHETGNTQDSVWSCGQVMGLIDDVPSCQELVDNIITEAQETIKNRLSGFLVPGSKL